MVVNDAEGDELKRKQEKAAAKKKGHEVEDSDSDDDFRGSKALRKSLKEKALTRNKASVGITKKKSTI